LLTPWVTASKLLAAPAWLKLKGVAVHWLVKHTAAVRAKPDGSPRLGGGALQIPDKLFTYWQRRHCGVSCVVRSVGMFCCSTTAPQHHAFIIRLCESVFHSLVMPRLDYCNATLACLSTSQLRRLQSVLNAAARLIRRSSRYEHVTPMLRDLHWLRSPQRIYFKLAVLVYRCLHGLAPRYLSDHI